MRRLSSHGNHVMHTCSQDTKFLKSTDGPHTATPLGLLTRGYRRVSPMRRRIYLFHKCLARNRSLGNRIFMNENGGEEFGSKQAGLKSIIYIHNVCISRSQIPSPVYTGSVLCGFLGLGGGAFWLITCLSAHWSVRVRCTLFGCHRRSVYLFPFIYVCRLDYLCSTLYSCIDIRSVSCFALPSFRSSEVC